MSEDPPETRAWLREQFAQLNARLDRLAGPDGGLMRTTEDREAAEARAEGRLIVTEYPYHPRQRPIEDAAGGRRLAARLHAEQDRYAATLRGVARLFSDAPGSDVLRQPKLASFPRDE